MRRGALFAALLLGAVLVAPSSRPAEPALSASQLARLSVPPGEYSWRDAVRLGLVRAEDFARLPGEPICPPMNAKASPAPRVRPGATCWRSPDEQGVVIIVPGFLDPVIGAPPNR